jgi:hypothetical protein
MLPSSQAKFIMRDCTPLQPSGHCCGAEVVSHTTGANQLAHVAPSAPHVPVAPFCVHGSPHTQAYSDGGGRKMSGPSKLAGAMPAKRAKATNMAATVGDW